MLLDTFLILVDFAAIWAFKVILSPSFLLVGIVLLLVAFPVVLASKMLECEPLVTEEALQWHQLVVHLS